MRWRQAKKLYRLDGKDTCKCGQRGDGEHTCRSRGGSPRRWSAYLRIRPRVFARLLGPIPDDDAFLRSPHWLCSAGHRHPLATRGRCYECSAPAQLVAGQHWVGGEQPDRGVIEAK